MIRFLVRAALSGAFAAGFLVAQPSPSTTQGFDVSAMDKSVDPCVNFYQYACGTWLKNNPIPADRSRWGRFDELDERNHTILRDILEKAAVPDPKRSALEQKIGDHYASCMDEATVEYKGVAPLKPGLESIARLTSKAALIDELVRLHRIDAGAAFSFGSGQDFKDSSQVIAQLDQGGLGLPDRDYYFKDDAKSVEIRKAYVAHVQKMFELLGDTPLKAAAKAAIVMEVETELARGALDRVSRRDPVKVYHKMTVKELAALTPAISWTRYFTGIRAPKIESLNVAEPEFVKGLNKLVVSRSLEDWKTYLAWQLAHSHAALLPAAFVAANFDFYGKTLTGAKELRPRWKRCVSYADNDLGEAVGQKYVDLTFGVEGKERTLKMVNALEKAMGNDIQKLTWMSPRTKDAALTKLRAVANKIGYPEKWRDYSTVTIARGDAVGNHQRATQFEVQRQLSKIGKPVDRTEWQMTPPTVNAYYDPQMNNINFPAGILQPPFYDNKLDDAVNFGAIGAVIGHELTHGFDDEGRQFDPRGNLRDWWTPEDAKEFEKRAECIVKEYTEFSPVPDVKINGKLTLGENTADNGGARIAYMSLQNVLANHRVAKIDGFTPEQRFFLGYGQIWCQNSTPEQSRLLANIDPHSPPEFRVNGVVSNMPEFQSAFSCKVGQPMVRKEACSVW